MPFGDGKSLSDAYTRAEQGGYAFMANNVAEANVLLGLLRAYAEANSDLVVQVSPGAAKFAGGGDKKAGLRALCRMIQATADAFPISVFINLDHFTSGEFDLIQLAIEEGLVSSIMIDASSESFDENVRISRRVTEWAKGTGILIEAELGKIKRVIIRNAAAGCNRAVTVAELIERFLAEIIHGGVGLNGCAGFGFQIAFTADLLNLRPARKLGGVSGFGFSTPGLNAFGACGVAGFLIVARKDFLDGRLFRVHSVANGQLF